MSDSNSQLHWSEEQWNRVRQVVYEEARKARVAGNFLPLYGPLEPDAQFVADVDLQESQDPAKGFTIDDSSTLKLVTIEVFVRLKSAQVSDPELDNALFAFRRAANVIARQEDEVIFLGHNATQARARPGHVKCEEKCPGLLDPNWPRRNATPIPPLAALVALGEQVTSKVSIAIGNLENRNHLGPFACVLDQHYFAAVQTPPPGSPVLPQERILPFLGGGALLRSSTLPPQTGLVVALGGAPIDLVVASDISVKFLTVEVNASHGIQYVFRVHEKIRLRLKQKSAVEAF